MLDIRGRALVKKNKMENPQFTNSEIYHIYNRGTDKRTIFEERGDYVRFIHNLFEFNDKEPALFYRCDKLRQKNKLCSTSEVEHSSQAIEFAKVKGDKPRKLLVEILTWCLMPNHFHLMLRQLLDGGISLFMQKLGIGYTKSFNEKNERSGVLFQGKFKAIWLKSQSHFNYLPFYIHSNPLDLIEPEWRQGKIKNLAKATRFLENYRWSSHPDYMGIKNFPSVSQRDFLLDVFEGQANYKKQFNDWLSSMKQEKMDDFFDVIIE